MMVGNMEVSFCLLSVWLLLAVVATPPQVAMLLLGCSLGSAGYLGVYCSVWYGVMVWLVFISGIMVIFLFFCALTPNPSMGQTSTFLWLAPLTGVLYSIPPSLELGGGWGCQQFIMYQGASPLMLVWLAGYLLAAMVVVVKTCPEAGGALREP